MDAKPNPTTELIDLRVALLYALFGGLWILLSDRLLEALVTDTKTVSVLQTYKGWTFVGISAFLIYSLLKHELALRRIAEEGRYESEERYRLLFEHSIDAIIFSVPDGAAYAANPAACRMFGWTDAEFQTRRRNDIVDTSDPRLPSALEERSLTGSFQGELTFIRKDGSKFPAEISSMIFTDQRGLERTSTILRDISERKQAEEELRSLNTELEKRVEKRTEELTHMNRELEHVSRAKDEFLANMSHELRTPLNSILGLSESLLEEKRGALNEYQQTSLQIIESSGHHLLDLINDILDLSKIEAGKFDFYPQPMLVDDLCRASLPFIKALAVKKSITVTYTNEATVSHIFADPRRLKQVLVNLLMNAVKFTAENGSITLKVSSDPTREFIHFSVIDNGIGIATQDLTQLFQPFVQVDSGLNRQYEGTGLGLALVHKLTDLHGGSVSVESEVGKGSCFTVNLACKLEEVEKFQALQSGESNQKRTEGAAVFSGGSAPHGMILLAEDNMPNILTLSDYLESHGYQVTVAHDGLEALTLAEQLNPDLILMDIQMPSMNGLEAIAHLRSDGRFASTPIIALTALAMPGDRERCLKAGATEYMSKPVNLKTLLKMVERFMAPHQPAPSP
jgi:PAS domain S-box-containing protein